MRKQLIAATGLNVVAQAVGFFKLWLIARLFGVGAELDGYYLALVAPTLLSGVLSGALQTGLFPVRARLAVAGDMDLVARFERAVLLGASSLGLLIAVLLVVLGDALRAWVAPGASADTHAALRLVWPYAASLVALNAAGDTLSYLLAMRERYAYAAAAPILNALVGAGVLLAWPDGGLTSLAVSTVAGVAMQVLMCAAAVRYFAFKLGGPLRQPGDNLRDFLDLVRLAIWIIPALVASNMNNALPPLLLARHGEGAVSAFSFAFRFHTLALQLVMAASPVLLAHFASLAARNDSLSVDRILKRATIRLLLLGAVAIGFVAIVGPYLVSAVFSGRFDSAAAQRVAQHWFWLTCGMAPAAMGIVYAKLWQARGWALQISVLAVGGLVLLLVLSALLAPVLSEFAVAASLSATAIGITAGYWFGERANAFRRARNAS
jgi:peptidoglycan biosynthesis protein MviN/MurJ (putative lipid II flippase)